MIVRPFRDPDTMTLTAILNEIVARGDAFVHDTPFTPDSTRAWIGAHAAAFVAARDGAAPVAKHDGVARVAKPDGAAMADDAVVGGYVLQPNQPGRGSHVCNAAYMVAESARGSGAGRVLGEHSLVEAKRLGFTAMQFNAVVATNEPAVRLWKSLGFDTIGTLPGAFRRGDDRLVDLYVMYRKL